VYEDYLTLGDIIPEKQPSVEDAVFLKLGFIEAFRSLRKNDKIILIMLIFGMSVNEMKQAMGIGNSAVKMRSMRARNRFKEKLLEQEIIL
jgi:predicted RNA polymerase sigma factor